MGVQPTSLEAYTEIQWHLAKDQEIVYNCIKEHPNMSDSEILIYLQTHHPKSKNPRSENRSSNRTKGYEMDNSKINEVIDWDEYFQDITERILRSKK
jgi:hypothetical protein